MSTTAYIRFGTVDIATIRDLQEKHFDDKKPKVEILGQMVKLFGTSKRMLTFYKKGTQCSACGLQASFYALERGIKDPVTHPYHLNLYGVGQDGSDVLFTHDHTTARSAGGADNMTNLTTMCGPCNWSKGEKERK